MPTLPFRTGNNMPRRTRYAGLDIATIGGRFEHLLQHAWGGRQREMAADLGVSQGLISKVARGEQAPGPKLVEALAALPRVNETWLYTGKGEPLVPPPNPPKVQDYDLPVARRLLPGPVGRHSELLTDDRYPVAASLHSESCYWYEVQAGDLILDEVAQKVEVGDLLLMQTDPLMCRDRLEVLGKRCVVRTFFNRLSPDLPEYMLAEVGWDPRGRRPTFFPFGVGERIQIDNPTPTTSAEDNPEALRRLDESFQMSFEDIVALNVLLVRR